MGVFSSAFRDGDVFIDFPYEEVMFRFEKSTGKVYRKFYGSSHEDEVPRNLKLYGDARMAGVQTTAELYAQGRPRHGDP